MRPYGARAVSARRGAEMRGALPLAILLLAAPAFAAPNVPVPPQSRWSSLPRLALKPSFKPSASWIRKAQQLEAEGKCRFVGKQGGMTRIEVPFAVLLTATGKVSAVRVAETGCAPLETYLAGVVRGFGPQIVRPKGTPPFWRGSRFIAGWQS